jgi:hypothetical protein
VEVKEPGSTLRYEKGWVSKMVINGFGSICSFVVMVVFAATKFKDGAWIVILLTPILVTIFFSIHRHYKHLAKQLSLDHKYVITRARRNRVIIAIGGVHRGTLAALQFARTISDDVTAVHVSIDPNETAKIEGKWDYWGDGYRLVILNSPYRLMLEPLLEYIDKIDAHSQPGDLITIVVPQFVAKHWWTEWLHTRNAETLRKALLHKENVVITEVPYQVN